MNKAYTSYVPINQKWAKQIPSHWDARRMKAVFAMRKERNNPIVTENILSLTAKQGVVPYAEKEGQVAMSLRATLRSTMYVMKTICL